MRIPLKQLQEAILPLVAKPNRYVRPFETWTPQGDPGRGRICLVGPESYESDLACPELPSLLAALEGDEAGATASGSAGGPCVDLVVAPDADLEAELRAGGLLLAGVATREPLVTHDVVVFLLHHVLNLPDMVRLLELGGVPPRRGARTGDHPIVLAAGVGVLAPGAVLGFADAVLCGDAECFARDILRLATRRHEGIPREILLRELEFVSGVHVSLQGARAEEGLEARWMETLPSALRMPRVPIGEIAASGVLLEIARTAGPDNPGAPPARLRARRPEAVAMDAEVVLAASGEREITLCGSGAGRHPELTRLLEGLNARLAGFDVRVRLDAVDPGSLRPAVARELRKGGRSRLDLRPVLASERLRGLAGRSLSRAEFVESLGVVWRGGWTSLSLPVVLGHPLEKESDRLEMLEIADTLADFPGAQRPPKVGIEILPWVPSPSSGAAPAFAGWAAGLRETAAVWARRLRKDRVRVTLRPPEMARAEDLLAHGGERVVEGVEEVVRRGGIRQADPEHFDVALWSALLAEIGDALVMNPSVFAAPDEAPAPAGEGERVGADAVAPGGLGSAAWLAAGRRPRRVSRERAARTADRYRLRLAKGESLRFTSHLEWGRMIERGLRRAQLPVAVSQGKDRRFKVAYGPPLPLGMTSAAEYVDLTLSREVPETFVLELSELLPEGLAVIAAAPIRRDAASLASAIAIADYEVAVPDDMVRSGLGLSSFDELKAFLEERATAALAASSLDVVKHRGAAPRSVNARPSLIQAGVVRDDGGRPLLSLRLALNRPDSVRPEALTAALCGEATLDERRLRVHRSRLHIPGRNQLLDPLDVVASGFAWWRQPVRGGTVL